MASTNVTSASLRKTAAAKNSTGTTTTSSVAGASATEKAAPIKYSHRQQKSYNPADLPQFTVPDLTIKDLLSAIPAHCFERSAFRSFQYVFMDFALIALLGYAATFIDPFTATFDFASRSPVPTTVLAAATQATATRWALWLAYTFAQGLVFTGVWIIAHECGHQSFSTSKTLNNSVGWVLHSLLLVPYHSWRISHARHHAATGHMTRDEVFVPRTRAQKGLLPLRPASASAAEEAEEEAEVNQATTSQKGTASSSSSDSATLVPDYEAGGKETWGEWFHELLEDAPAYNLVNIVGQQLFGWPLYLIKNTSGQLHYPKGTNHFSPESVIFDSRHRSQIIVSDIGLALVFAALYYAGTVAPRGFFDVFRYYVVPYLYCNHWLVMITCLQHTDVALPHYKAEEWTFPRGALCTIDRSWLWPIGPYLFHGIAETHVLHHVSSKIPHYNAWEATEALKQRLGEHYKYNDENVFLSLWKNVQVCKFVDENDKVAFYRNADGVPSAVVAPRKDEANSDSGLALSD